MGYIEQKWKSQNGEFVIKDKYHSMRMMPRNPVTRERRKKRTGKTTELQEKINLRHRTEKLARLIMDNFQPGDWWISFKLKEVVSLDRFKDEYEKMIRRLRGFFRKHNKELKYIAVHENICGRGRLHGHILLPTIPGVFFPAMKKALEKAWTLGDCHFQPYEGKAMDAMKVAAYMTKEDVITTKLNEKAKLLQEGGDNKALDAEIRAKRSRICPSQNLIRTKPVKKQIKSADTYSDNMTPPKGYHLVKALSYNGYTVDGYPYQHAVYERDG